MSSPNLAAPEARRAEASPPKPLLIHPGAIGDLIRLTATARQLARRWGAPCDLIARHAAASLVFAGLGTVAAIRHWPSRSRPYHLDPVQWRLVDWLRARPAGPVHLFEERVHRIVPWRAQTRMEWLLARARVPLAHQVVARAHPREPLESFVAYAGRLAAIDPEGLAVPPGGADDTPDPLPELSVSEAELADCRRWLGEAVPTSGGEVAGQPEGRSIVLLQTTSRRTTRGRWPVANWSQLIGCLLARRPSSTVLLLGTGSERSQTASLAKACADPRVVDVAGSVPLRRLFALFELGGSCISLDTGPAHAAAALGCPLVVLAGRADPRRNLPVGPGRVELVAAWPPERWPDSPEAWSAEHRLDEIEVEPVFAAWKSLVDGG